MTGRLNDPPTLARRGVGLGILALAVCVPLQFSTGFDLARFELTAVFILAAIGFNFAFGIGGQLAIGQPVLLAVGGYTAGILSVRYGWGVEKTLVPSVLAAVVASVILGLPSLRIRGWYFAITSFFAINIQPDVLELLDKHTGGSRGLVGIEGLKWRGDVLEPWVVYELFLAALVLCFVGTTRLSKSGWGLSLRLLRDHPVASAATGVNPVWAKARIYALTAIPCGIAGALYAHSVRYLAPTVFNFDLVLVILGGTFLGGRGKMWGPVIGVAVFQAISLWIGPFSSYNQLFLGLGVLVTAIVFKGGIIEGANAVAARVRGRRIDTAGELEDESLAGVGDPDAAADFTGAPIEPVGLRVSGVEKRFGGNLVLAGIDLEVPAGQMVGFVGPNGSGKTTMLNIISAFHQPDAGRVLLGDRDVTGSTTYQIARHGLARTFQVPRLVDELTVGENVELGEIGLDRQRAASGLARLPGFSRTDRARAERAVAVCRFLGFSDEVIHSPAGRLPLGLKRLTEIGRAIAAGAPMICLDEPAAGLDDAEREALGIVLRRLVGQGRTILLVEHNLRFVLENCHSVVLLTDGLIVGQGAPRDRESWGPELVEYFGTYLFDVEEAPLPQAAAQ
jgi:branched-chain amino acid transport system permease protein